MMQIEKSMGDNYEPRFRNGSIKCLFSPLAIIDSTIKRLSYNQLHQQPLRLSVLKLDGSSFGIEVSKMGTVGLLKQAVQSAFDHLPKQGTGTISWEHVWGQFCLCHKGQKLLTDSDRIRMFGIKDGDELEFIHHISTTNIFVRRRSRGDTDVDGEPRISVGYSDGRRSSEKDDSNFIKILEDNQGDLPESEDDVVSRREHRSLKGWFQHNKLSSSRMRIAERSYSSRFCHNTLGSFKNYLRFSSNKYESRRMISLASQLEN